MNKLLLLAMPLLLGTLASCGPDSLPPAEYVQYVSNPDNGLKRSKTIGDYTYSVQYKPVDYVIANEARKPDLTTTERDARKSELDGLQYFTFRVANATGGQDVLTLNNQTEQDYSAKVGYLSFDFQHDIALVDGGDTLGCKLYNFVRTYGLAPYVDFVMAFDKPSEDETTNSDKTLIVEDRVFGAGTIKFAIDAGDIKALPLMESY